MQQQITFKLAAAQRQFRPLLSVLALGAASLAGCGGGTAPGQTRTDETPVIAPATVETSGKAFQDQRFHAKLQGAWRVLGEGSLLEIRDNAVEQFQETPSLCYREQTTTPTDALKEMTFRHSAAGEQAKANLHLMPDMPSTYTLERITQIPPSCRAAPPTDALTSYRAMAEIFSQDYAFFQERHIDWAARIKALGPKADGARGDEALQAVLIEALQGFNDPHVNLVRLNQGKPPALVFNADGSAALAMLRQAHAQQTAVPDFDAFQAQWQEQLQNAVQDRLSGGSKGRVLDGAMSWGMLSGNIGYIGLSRLARFSADAGLQSDLTLIRKEMDSALQAMASSKAIIVDIAVNDGGYDLVSAEVAGSFADMRRLAFTVQQQRAQGREAQRYFVTPKGSKPYVKPVYLLTSDRTISAGDTLTLMMRELPHVTHVGQPTSGAMSNLLAKSLPGNFVVTLSNERYADPRGNVYEGRGIPPKVAIEVFKPADRSVLHSSHGAALTALVDIIHR
jgi:carboxyl-terminal processing protease